MPLFPVVKARYVSYVTNGRRANKDTILASEVKC